MIFTHAWILQTLPNETKKFSFRFITFIFFLNIFVRNFDEKNPVFKKSFLTQKSKNSFKHGPGAGNDAPGAGIEKYALGRQQLILGKIGLNLGTRAENLGLNLGSIVGVTLKHFHFFGYKNGAGRGGRGHGLDIVVDIHHWDQGTVQGIEAVFAGNGT